MASEEDAKIRQQIRILKDTDSNDEEKANAAWSLGNLCRGPESRLAIEAAGGVPPLVKLLNDGHDFAKGQAAQVLSELAKEGQVAKAIVVDGGREPLEALAEDPRDEETVKWGSDLARKALKRLPEETKELMEIREHIQVLKDPKANDEAKRKAASGLGFLAYDDEKVQSDIEAEGALPLLVALLQEAGDATKREAILTLRALAEDNVQLARAIMDCGAREPLEALAKDPRDDELSKLGRDSAQDVLKLLPEARRSRPARRNPVQVEVKALENGTSDEQCKAAEQLGNWAASSDEKRAAIRQAGGCEGLVALVVNGSEDAKWHAARALRNLANHAEAKESILKADGIAILTPIAKHGRGKVNEAASEALNLLSLADAKAKPDSSADNKPAA